ncbi:hypothetical protein BVI2075_150045 [Burkholderia vietnamiensis]|nr:hypothetical protein BVI2075_150045 [Burkholderia vietnamiensis]
MRRAATAVLPPTARHATRTTGIHDGEATRVARRAEPRAAPAQRAADERLQPAEAVGDRDRQLPVRAGRDGGRDRAEAARRAAGRPAGLPADPHDRACDRTAYDQHARALGRRRAAVDRDRRRPHRPDDRHHPALRAHGAEPAEPARPTDADRRADARAHAGVDRQPAAGRRRADEGEGRAADALAHGPAPARRQERRARLRPRAVRDGHRRDDRDRRRTWQGTPAAVDGARHARVALRRIVPPDRVRADQDLGDQRGVHRHLPARRAADLPAAAAAVEDARARHVHRRAAAGDRQPRLEHADRRRVAVGEHGHRDRVSRVPDRDPQARILPEREDHRRPDRIARMGAAARDADHGGRVRAAGRDRRADLLRVREARAVHAAADLTPRAAARPAKKTPRS